MNFFKWLFGGYNPINELRKHRRMYHEAMTRLIMQNIEEGNGLFFKLNKMKEEE